MSVLEILWYGKILKISFPLSPQKVDFPKGQVTFHSYLPNGQGIRVGRMPTKLYKKSQRTTKELLKASKM